MSVVGNKAIVHRLADEVWKKGNIAVADGIFAADFIGHIPGMPDISGSEGVKGFIEMIRAALPDVCWAVEDDVAEGDKVVTRYTVSGTHQGDLMGIPPTGKRVMYMAMSINRFANDRIAEFWGVSDMMGMMQQLGVVPGAGSEEIADSESRGAGDGSSNPEENKAIMRRFFKEVLNGKNLAVAGEIVDADYVLHIPPNPDVQSLKGFEQFISGMFDAFPGCQYTIEDMMAEGDRVAVRWTVTGTHKGELMGIPPTSNQMEAAAIGIVRMANGKMQEDWSCVDFLGMMQQLGVVPA
jgi:predicted ester cyclase